MKSTTLLFLSFGLLFGALLPQNAAAQTFNWGGTLSFTPTQDKYFDSTGAPLPSGSKYEFAVGYFQGGFSPTASNISDWHSNWVELGATSLSDGSPWTFGGIGNVVSSASDGQNAYLWIYNGFGQLGLAGGDAFLGTGDWILPTFGSITPAPTFDFANMNSVIFGQADTDYNPGMGFDGGVLVGGGTFGSQKADNQFEAQLGTISVVPEPSGAFLILTCGMALLLRRRRSHLPPTEQPRFL